MVAFDCILPGEAGFAFIPYSVSIKIFLNLRPKNSPPQSDMISIGQGYLVIHVISTKFAIFIALLLLYCVISNHKVTGSIIVKAFRIKGFSPFLRIL